MDVASSTRWAPTAITRAEYGEEIIYPDFRLREPIFAPSRVEHDRPEWRNLIGGIRERAAWCSEKEWVCYRGQHGQNIILVNATYTGNPPADSWSDVSCMGDGVSIAGIEILSKNTTLTDAEYSAKYPIDSLLVAISPDSWSFQHFLDRITHIVSQGTHLTRDSSDTEVITGCAPSGAVSEMWGMLGFPANKMHHSAPVGVKAMIFSCRTPLVHPWLSLRTLEKFGLNNTGVPLEQRKKVVYFSRSHRNTSNGGRRVLNERELLDSIRTLLVERDQGEELVIFQPDEFGSQRKPMTWFHEHVRAVIGPHGGAMYNHRWAGAGTLVLEMMPKSFTSLMFWEEASILDQVYANMLLQEAGGTDMFADIPAVLDILGEHLGKPDPRGAGLKETYRWRGAELQVTLAV